MSHQTSTRSSVAALCSYNQTQGNSEYILYEIHDDVSEGALELECDRDYTTYTSEQPRRNNL